MGDSEEKVAMLSLGWYVLFSFRKQARERKGRRVREERRRIQIPTEYDFFFPAGSFQKADVMWGMLKCWFVVNSPGKHSWGGNCRKAVCMWISIPDGGPELTECWCQEQHTLLKHPSPPKNCKSANCTNCPNLYQYPVKCSQSCHLTCLNKKVLLCFSKQMYPLIETKNPTLYINKIINKLPDPISRMSLPPNNWISLARDTSLLFLAAVVPIETVIGPPPAPQNVHGWEETTIALGATPAQEGSFVLGTPEKLFASTLVQGSQAFFSFNSFEKKEQWKTLKLFPHILQILGLHRT